MYLRRDLVETPFFSICIPQFNRTSFLLRCCQTLTEQDFKDFEVCISDDCSTDVRENEITDFLIESGLSFVFKRRQNNGRYDANLRSSIALSKGRYCFLLGNDDCLASRDVLFDIHADIVGAGPVDVVLTNFADYASGTPTRRVQNDRVLDGNAMAAAGAFRNFSFVSGVILNGNRARSDATSKWDGSEMYQMYLGCRMIAEGGRLLELDRVAVLKDIQVEGEQVDAYARRAKVDPCSIEERYHPIALIPRLVMDALGATASESVASSIAERVVAQLYAFTYSFWIFEHRRIQSWRYALGICLGMRPRNVCQGLPLSSAARIRLTALYVATTFAGLSLPLGLLQTLRVHLYSLAKSIG